MSCLTDAVPDAVLDCLAPGITNCHLDTHSRIQALPNSRVSTVPPPDPSSPAHHRKPSYPIPLPTQQHRLTERSLLSPDRHPRDSARQPRRPAVSRGAQHLHSIAQHCTPVSGRKTSADWVPGVCETDVNAARVWYAMLRMERDETRLGR